MDQSRIKGGSLLGALVSGALVDGTLCGTPAANATCAFFGIGNNADCTSTLFSAAIAIGPGAQAYAEGAFGTSRRRGVGCARGGPARRVSCPRRRSMGRFRRSSCETWRWCSGSDRPPELTEHPGAEYDTKSWQGAVDVGVRVRLKMVGQHDLKLDDLVVELSDDMHRRGGGGPERSGGRIGCGQVRRAQRGLDLPRPVCRYCVDATLHGFDRRSVVHQRTCPTVSLFVGRPGCRCPLLEISATDRQRWGNHGGPDAGEDR